MPRISWINTGSSYRRMEGDIVNIPTVPPGIYEVQLDLSGWSLQRTADSFVFPYKVYHLQREFLDHVKNTYKALNGNIGVLFNGTRGTGKSVSAKILANELNLPVIIVKSMGDNNDGQISYLSSFNFDCIFFFDEFEKQFNERDCSILQFMDGVYTSEYRRIFLLTTNDLTVNENLLSRPSRIRYVREFGNLEKEIVDEYLEDNLKDKSFKKELMDYVDTLTISTIDILKSIVEEVNIHGMEQFLKIKKSFNVSTAVYNYRVIRGYINTSIVDKVHYNVNKFIDEAGRYDKRWQLSQERDVALSMCKNDSERKKVIEEFNALSRYEASMDRCTIDDVDKAWDKLIPNKDEFDGETVIAVDREKKVVVTLNESYFGFYFITNPDEKPSLYKERKFVNYDYLM
ncbi:MAG: AAA family ATPase [Clostridiales bacterium]|nr:AAA family ATPase [Clostridiales bacterium]